MSSTVITPTTGYVICRAKDPATCKYHGLALAGNAATAATLTTDRGELVDTIVSSFRDNDFVAYQDAVNALHTYDAEVGTPPASSTRAAVHPGLVNVDAETIERDRLIAEGTAAELQAFVEERINRPEFRDMLNQRDAARDLAKDLKAEHKFLEDAYKANLDMDYDIVQQKGFELLEANTDLQVLKAQANTYKDITAPAINRIAELEEARMRENGTWQEYTAPTLNGLIEIGEFENGSRAWLENRQGGLGGSDIGILTKAYANGRITEEDLICSKIDPISDEEVEAQALGHAAFAGYTGRGHAWEPHIFNMYKAQHPEQNVTFCKTSWKSASIDYQYANFDGLLADKNGRPNGILEIKTASDPSKWQEIGTPEENLNRIPPGYKAQVLWYCQAAGFKKGVVAVMIDDHEYREYPFKITPEFQAEQRENLEAANTFMQKLNLRRTDPNAASPVAARRSGFGPTIMNAARTTFTGRSDLTRARSAQQAFGAAAVWREETVAQTQARFEQLCVDIKDEDEVRSALYTLFAEKDPTTRKKLFVNVDIETSGNGSPTAGHIIDVGMSVRNAAGEEVAKHDSLYGIPKKLERIRETGAQDIHHIGIGMIKGKRQFSNPEVQKEILDQLKGNILVAHNALYEKRWFRQHLNGFANAERKGEIQVIDTMRLTEWFLPNATSNRLESMCKEFGISYLDMHRAKKDADAMGDALTALVKKINSEN